MELEKEKCIVCNGTGSGMTFKDGSWQRDESDCERCNGSGFIEYYYYKSGFINQKVIVT